MNPNRVRSLLVALPAALMLIAGGCDRGPTAPTLPVRAPATPPTTPEATFDISLSGQVIDNVGRPLVDATVEVTDGPRGGVFALTDASGGYALPGVFSGSVTLRASKAGYLTVAQMFFGGHPGENIFGFRLQTPTSVNLLGNYTLTISVDPACPAFPFEAQSRTYQATANPAPNSANAYLVTLTGATFSFNYNRVFAFVAGDFIAFRFDSDIDNGPSHGRIELGDDDLVPRASQRIVRRAEPLSPFHWRAGLSRRQRHGGSVQFIQSHPHSDPPSLKLRRGRLDGLQRFTVRPGRLNV